MAEKNKISRRELFTFWRREKPPEPAPAPAPPPPALGWDREWPRDKIPGPAFGRPLPLRPPGNMHEYILRDACTRCGKCVEVCPADAIVQLDASWGESAVNTPAIFARTSPCVLCDGYQCTKVCPSGALQPLYGNDQVKMGTASVDPKRCVTYSGQSCSACVDVCPVKGAIAIGEDGHPRVDEFRCVGCGLCVRACPTEPTSIDVVPRD
jgi:ferredoxin-type protein NapG